MLGYDGCAWSRGAGDAWSRAGAFPTRCLQMRAPEAPEEMDPSFDPAGPGQIHDGFNIAPVGVLARIGAEAAIDEGLKELVSLPGAIGLGSSP